MSSTVELPLIACQATHQVIRGIHNCHDNPKGQCQPLFTKEELSNVIQNIVRKYRNCIKTRERTSFYYVFTFCCTYTISLNLYNIPQRQVLLLEAHFFSDHETNAGNRLKNWYRAHSYKVVEMQFEPNFSLSLGYSHWTLLLVKVVNR